MSIADQVATVEHDLAAALAQIDELKSANAAFASANASLQRDNVGLQLEVNDMKHYVDDTRAMAEQLANSALDMLRASRRQVGGQAEIIPYAPKRHNPLTADQIVRANDLSDEQLSNHVADVAIKAGYLLTPDEKDNVIHSVKAINATVSNFKVDETGKVHLLDTPAQRAVTEIMAGDSGDEQPEPTVFETMQADVTAPLSAPLGFIHCKDCPDPPRCTIDSKWCDKSPGPMLVEHGPDDLPIFLRSAPSDRAAVFG